MSRDVVMIMDIIQHDDDDDDVDDVWEMMEMNQMSIFSWIAVYFTTFLSDVFMRFAVVADAFFAVGGCDGEVEGVADKVISIPCSLFSAILSVSMMVCSCCCG